MYLHRILNNILTRMIDFVYHEMIKQKNNALSRQLFCSKKTFYVVTSIIHEYIFNVNFLCQLSLHQGHIYNYWQYSSNKRPRKTFIPEYMNHARKIKSRNAHGK